MDADGADPGGQRPGLLARAAQRLSADALTPAGREHRRRAALGMEGRIAEDVVTLVELCGRVWEELAAKGLPQDLTLAEMRHLEELLDARGPDEPGRTEPALSLSIAMDEPDHLQVVRALVPGGSGRLAGEGIEADAYRYAVLHPRTGVPEPFLVALDRGPVERPGPDAGVVAVVLLAPTFLRYEQEMGAVNPLAVQGLEAVVRTDLDAVLETRRALGGA